MGVTRDEKTGALVLVVGCVHGAMASANDVRTVISRSQPDAVVLELCQPRLEGLMHTSGQGPNPKLSDSRHFDLQVDNSIDGAATDSNTNRTPRILSTVRKNKQTLFGTFSGMIQKFGGVGPAVVAFALNGVYGIQRRAGFDPGVEFKVAISEAGAQARKCRLVCGDSLASDTVQNIFRAMSRPLRAISRAPRTLWCALHRVFQPPDGSVNIPRVLAENNFARIREFFSVFAPAVMLLYSSVLLSSVGSVYLRTLLFGASSLAGSNALDSPPTAISRVLVGVIDVTNFMLIAYIFLSALTLLDVLIDARDRVLAKSVQDTIRSICNERGLAAQHRQVAEPAALDRGIVIVVVVGLLHVNGILEHFSRLNE